MHAVTQKPSAYAVITVFIQMIVTKRNANPSAADVQNKTVPGAVLFLLFLMRCYGYGHVSYTGHCLNDIRIHTQSIRIRIHIEKSLHLLIRLHGSGWLLKYGKRVKCLQEQERFAIMAHVS